MFFWFDEDISPGVPPVDLGMLFDDGDEMFFDDNEVMEYDG